VIKVAGTFAWASYQWDFSASVDGQPSAAQGQTTLVLEKRNNHWTIVHNHTSMVQQMNPAQGAPGTPPTAKPEPGKPPAT
jgi:ketosteroid isomerase-like protein